MVLHDRVVVIRRSLVESGDLVEGILIALEQKANLAISGGTMQISRKINYINHSNIIEKSHDNIFITWSMVLEV